MLKGFIRRIDLNTALNIYDPNKASKNVPQWNYHKFKKHTKKARK